MGQDSSIVFKLEQLEGEIKTLNDSISAQTLKLKQYEQYNKSLSDIPAFFENPVKWLITNGLISVALLITLFWILNKTSPQWYEKLIQKWIEKYEKINVLKANKKILVVSATINPDNEVFLNKLLSEDEFKRVVHTSMQEAEDYLKKNRNKDKVDLVFANNENGQLNQNALEELIADRKYIAMFYFGNTGSWDFKGTISRNSELLKRINFANSRSQIYGNLISSLKFQETLLGLA